MNKVINGKMYDTKKAEKIKTYKEMWNENNGEIYKGEVLYKKTTGEYFREIINYVELCNGVDEEFFNYLEPLRVEEAREWLERHGTGDEYVKEFGEVDE